MNSLMTVFPHPDDETFSAGGILALHAHAGAQVTVLCGTRGELGRHMGRPPFATRETLPALRERELRDALAVLGVHDVRFLNLHDKTLEFEDPVELAARVRRVIEDARPETVVTHYPTWGVHPDHDAMGAATVRAVQDMPRGERPRVLLQALGRRGLKRDEMITRIGQPDVEFDISGALDLKIAALRAHASQTAGMFHDLEREIEEGKTTWEAWREQRQKERYWSLPQD